MKIFKNNSAKTKKKSKGKFSPSKMDSNFNNFFQQQLWGGGGKNLPRGEITSSDKNAPMSGQSSSSSASILAPSKLAQSQPPHSTNRDITTLSLDNRLYLDGLRHHHQQQQQHQARHGNSFSNGSMNIALNSGGGSSRDNNNNGLNNSQSMGFSSQKLLNRLDIDTIRSNVNRNVGNCNSNSSNIMHHQHGTILFNTLNGGLGPGGLSDCFNSSDYGHPDSTTPPPTAISMPPPASSASSSSSTISTNLGLNRNSNGSQDGNPEKVKTPNSIRGEISLIVSIKNI